MDLFRKFGPLLYLDLDTTIIGDISPLIEVAEKYRFITAENWNNPGHVNSTLMTWRDEMSHLSETFDADPNKYISQYAGDQDFIDDHENPVLIDELLPNFLQSYKIHIRKKSLHPDCRIIAFHGTPKPWDIDEQAFIGTR